MKKDLEHFLSQAPRIEYCKQQLTVLQLVMWCNVYRLNLDWVSINVSVTSRRHTLLWLDNDKLKGYRPDVDIGTETDEQQQIIFVLGHHDAWESLVWFDLTEKAFKKFSFIFSLADDTVVTILGHSDVMRCFIERKDRRLATRPGQSYVRREIVDIFQLPFQFIFLSTSQTNGLLFQKDIFSVLKLEHSHLEINGGRKKTSGWNRN